MTSEREDALIQAEADLESAMCDANIAALERLLHADATYTAPNGVTTSRTADILAYSSGALKINTLDANDLVAKVFGDTGITLVTLALNGQAGGECELCRLQARERAGAGDVLDFEREDRVRPQPRLADVRLSGRNLFPRSDYAWVGDLLSGCSCAGELKRLSKREYVIRL